jgi:hypothetical protein
MDEGPQCVADQTRLISSHRALAVATQVSRKAATKERKWEHHF